MEKFKFEPEHEHLVRDLLRRFGAQAAGAKQAADYIVRLEARVRDLEGRLDSANG